MLALMLLFAGKNLAGNSLDRFDPGPNPLLMRHPTISRTSIVFSFAGDLWSVAREGGQAKRLTSAPGTESDPFFSPDGSMIAFSGEYDGNFDVFVMPAAGGEPKRLTAHPAPDRTVGWTPDGKSVIFSSTMLSPTDYPRLFSVPVTGGVPNALPFPAGVEASMSPDGKRIAYVPIPKWQQAWKRYRGGQAAPIWVADLATSKWKAIPRGNEDDKCPMWVGDSIYYVSDPHGIMGLYRHDLSGGGLGGGRTTEVVPGVGFDIKSATAGPGAIVYEKLGSIWLYDLAKKNSMRVSIDIQGDFPEVRPQFKTVRPSGYAISPTGQRVAVTARGLLFTVPASKGDAHAVLTDSGIERKDPEWSPDGRTLAYLTEEGDIQRLGLYDLSTSKQRFVTLGEAPSVYHGPTWSPDGKSIVYSDVRLNIWCLDVASGKSKKLDTGRYAYSFGVSPRWSPDSKWITYAMAETNHEHSVYLCEVATGKKYRATDGLADANSPIFDRDGKHLYFLASTDVGEAEDEDIVAVGQTNRSSSVYAIVLKKGGPNPLQPESDEEGVEAKKPTPPKPGAATEIDPEGLTARTIALPIPAGEFRNLEPGPAGSFFLLSAGAVSKFSFADRKSSPFAGGVFGAELSAGGTKVLLIGAPSRIVSAMAPPSPGGPGLDFSGLQARIDPRVEWERMFHAVWRNERALFYDPKLHGIDANVMEARYAPFLPGIASRDDLNYLFTDMVGELSIGHMWARGGDLPGAGNRIPGGLLGCDFKIENGHYRLTRVYDGERWNPELYAPLAQPGVEAKAGEYLLEIDGRPLDDAMDIYEALEGKAKKQVRVKIGPTPDGVGAREAIVLPVASEAGLRFRAWTEDNRRVVEKATDGRVGYAHIPDTGGGGWTEFNRYYYAQQDKQGMIVDDRFNHGGYVADYFVREMNKHASYGTRTRYGQDALIPAAGVYGPKVMLTNEQAGSGGDIFPDEFRLQHAGKLIGKRTWGGQLAAFSFGLVDGGRVNAPDDALYDPIHGTWPIEGFGTPPDIEVEFDPYLWRQGHDAQLDAAIAEILKELKSYQPPLRKRPEYPDKSKIKG